MGLPCDCTSLGVATEQVEHWRPPHSPHLFLVDIDIGAHAQNPIGPLGSTTRASLPTVDTLKTVRGPRVLFHVDERQAFQPRHRVALSASW